MSDSSWWAGAMPIFINKIPPIVSVKSIPAMFRELRFDFDFITSVYDYFNESQKWNL